VLSMCTRSITLGEWNTYICSGRRDHHRMVDELPMQSVLITTDVVSSNDQGEMYSIM
jgi:hypothetical protein